MPTTAHRTAYNRFYHHLNRKFAPYRRLADLNVKLIEQVEQKKDLTATIWEIEKALGKLK